MEIKKNEALDTSLFNKSINETHISRVDFENRKDVYEKGLKRKSKISSTRNLHRPSILRREDLSHPNLNRSAIDIGAMKKKKKNIKRQNAKLWNLLDEVLDSPKEINRGGLAAFNFEEDTDDVINYKKFKDLKEEEIDEENITINGRKKQFTFYNKNNPFNNDKEDVGKLTLNDSDKVVKDLIGNLQANNEVRKDSVDGKIKIEINMLKPNKKITNKVLNLDEYINTKKENSNKQKSITSKYIDNFTNKEHLKDITKSLNYNVSNNYNAERNFIRKDDFNNMIVKETESKVYKKDNAIKNTYGPEKRVSFENNDKYIHYQNESIKPQFKYDNNIIISSNNSLKFKLTEENESELFNNFNELKIREEFIIEDNKYSNKLISNQIPKQMMLTQQQTNNNFQYLANSRKSSPYSKSKGPLLNANSVEESYKNSFITGNKIKNNFNNFQNQKFYYKNNNEESSFNKDDDIEPKYSGLVKHKYAFVKNNKKEFGLKRVSKLDKNTDRIVYSR